MKKVLFILAFVAVYGVSMAMSNATVVTVDETVVVVAEADEKAEKAVKEEGKKEKAAKASKSKGEGCSGTTDKPACSGDKATKSSDCASKKSSDCSSSAKKK